MNWRWLLIWIVLLAVSSCALSSNGGTGPPLKGQVVDAETGKPLKGVVVLAYWTKYTASPGGWAGGGFSDSEEVVTGPDGRFVIRPRPTYTIPGVTKVSYDVVIFKPGYGEWRIRSDKGDEAVIALPPLKTREERLKFYDSLRWSGLIPLERTKSLREAEDVERAYLGFRKMHEGRP